MSLGKTRRNRLCGAAASAAFALFQLYTARHAQVAHTVIPVKGSWYPPEIGYFLAFCFFALGGAFTIRPITVN
jgi:hypothetical protein